LKTFCNAWMPLETPRSLFSVAAVCCKELFFNIFFGGCLAFVLGLFLVKGLFFGVLVGCKEAVFNNVCDSFLGLVLGLFQLFGYVLEVSVYVGVSGGNTSVLAAAVLGVCGGSGGTVG